VIEMLALEALAQQACGDTDQALTTLGRAFASAEPEGYVRTFVDEGRPMAELLRQAVSHGIAPDYAAKLLAAFGMETKDEHLRLRAVQVGRQTKETVPSSFVCRPSSSTDPLSRREREVLRLIAAGLTNQEIAQELTVAVSTVKTHLKNIYAKLGVRNRTQAAARGRELDLV
jgi:LuxR family maltose regulon positive regulatory protein